ncbi:glycosyltransferase family protein [Flavobacterium algicola]|uniref:hypothetical protein n=1 Tax=Flavobacterium algicola TaxID=556529 RepID=UPI001EFC5557|nr:hypothetical protein [Flavobacterium algicola]MCG9793516.1 hypothetical protein [Flavobacterium algicola]
MKILFLCGSLEVGKDGVGDYTRLLGKELSKKGNNVQLLSLCDKEVEYFTTDVIDEVEEKMQKINRIPRAHSNSKRFEIVQKIIDDFEPEYISLQFVPYSFHPKGLPFWLPKMLRKVDGTHKWHIMFHELWIGMEQHAPLKNFIIGYVQKIVVKDILRLHPKLVINTQTSLYKKKLEKLGQIVSILPLISNIRMFESDDQNLKIEKPYVKFCMFGNIHFGAPVKEFILDLKKSVKETMDGKILKFIFIGQNGQHARIWKDTLLNNEIDYEETGFISDLEINKILGSCHYGVSTTPYILSQKSGSTAAMFQQKLRVITVARKWEVSGFEQEDLKNLHNYNNHLGLIQFLKGSYIYSNDHNLESVSQKFIGNLI